MNETQDCTTKRRNSAEKAEEATELLSRRLRKTRRRSRSPSKALYAAAEEENVRRRVGRKDQAAAMRRGLCGEMLAIKALDRLGGVSDELRAEQRPNFLAGRSYRAELDRHCKERHTDRGKGEPPAHTPSDAGTSTRCRRGRWSRDCRWLHIKDRCGPALVGVARRRVLRSMPPRLGVSALVARLKGARRRGTEQAASGCRPPRASALNP